MNKRYAWLAILSVMVAYIGGWYASEAPMLLRITISFCAGLIANTLLIIRDRKLRIDP